MPDAQCSVLTKSNADLQGIYMYSGQEQMACRHV